MTIAMTNVNPQYMSSTPVVVVFIWVGLYLRWKLQEVFLNSFLRVFFECDGLACFSLDSWRNYIVQFHLHFLFWQLEQWQSHLEGHRVFATDWTSSFWSHDVIKVVYFCCLLIYSLTSIDQRQEKLRLTEISHSPLVFGFILPIIENKFL